MATIGYCNRVQAARLSAIALILYGCGTATGDELAHKLGVNVRTVYRDITKLQEMGFPLVSAPGPKGGYMYNAVQSLNDCVPQEWDLLDLFIRTGLLASDQASIDSVIGLASETLSNTDLEMLCRARDRILFDPEEWYTRDRPPVNFSVLRSAVLSDRSLDIRFVERDSMQEFADTIDPYGLIWKGGFWYVLGYSHVLKRNRRLRAQRITSVVESDTSFTRPPEFDLKKSWQEELEDFGKGEIQVVLRIEAAAIPEFENFNWKRENRITKASDHWTVELRVDHFEWLIPLVLSFSGDIRVVRPKRLRILVKDCARALLDAHSNVRPSNRSLVRGHTADDSRSRAASFRRFRRD